jgi:diaminopropionate ammonia-lyase
MDQQIKAVHTKKTAICTYSTERFGYKQARQAQRFHASFPDYQPTPLVSLPSLSRILGVKSLFVKDESHRFGLNAFKVLGGSYAISNYIAQRLDMPISELTYERILRPDVQKRLNNLTFVTATDGNPGRGIAWTANQLHQKAVVYMPKGSSLERLQNIQALGAEASITNSNYDDTVRFARACAERYGWILVQDTAWAGYEEVPTWIMQGYTTMAMEVIQELEALGASRPTHIFLQAGVGSMAASMVGFFADLYRGEQLPFITIVESEKANCMYRTAEANDGQLHTVTGDLNTIMAGLACGEPCSLAWDVLRNDADSFISCPDWVAAKGMRILGHPVVGDQRIVSGENGAVTLGLIAELMQNPSLHCLRQQLQLDETSSILCFSTEGDTDRNSYRRIVWDGQYPSC